MKIIRFLAEDGSVRHGVVEDDVVRELLRPPVEGLVPMGTTWPLAAVRLLAPVRPTKMLCVGINYRDHAAEMGHPMPDEPVLFMKPTTALAGPSDAIVRPDGVGRVDYEAELAVVLGRRVRGITEAEADAAIFGYTCFNDVTARDLQKKDGQWTRAKGFDTFGVCGPWIETEIGDPDRLAIRCRVNGDERQASSTDQLAFGPRALVAWASRVMTLEPGDLIATGTPAGVGPLEVGDVVEVEVEGIGVLRSEVVAEREKLKPTRVV